MKEKKSKVTVEKFKSKLKMIRCSACRGSDYHVSDYFGNIKMSQSLKLPQGGPYLASVMVICKNCGLMSFYSVEALEEKK